MEKDERQEPTKDWLRPPLMRGEPLSSESSLLAATLAVGESNEVLGNRIDTLRAQRKGLTVLLITTCLVVIIQTIYGGIALQKISRTDDIATFYAAQQREYSVRAELRSDRVIFCVNDFAESLQDPAMSYDERCPRTHPHMTIP